MSLIDLPTESLCTICSFLIGELFDNDRDREQAKFKRTSHRKSHQLFKRSDDQHDDYLGEFGNTRFSLNEMLSLFSLKYSCKKMYQFVHENESLWFSVVFEFPGILNYQSCVERSRFMAMSMMVPEEESSFSEHFTNALTEKFIPDMEDDIFNALNMIDVLCDRKKVVKRLCLNYSAEVFNFPNVLEKRFQYLNDPSTGDSDHTVQLFDCKVLLEYFVEAFPNVQELILLERAGKLGARPNITSSLDMSVKRWMNMKHVAVDIVFENCVQLLVAHMSSLERITLMNNQNNFGVFVDICRQLIEKGVFTSEKLISVDLAGSIDSKHFHTLHALFKNFYGDHDTKYISKFRSLNVLQLSPSHEITNIDFTGLISNLVELTLVQYQSAETLDLSVFSFTSLKILNLKGCMQDLILKGMRAPVLHCMHLRMFNIPERETFDSLAHLTLDNCKGSDAEGWFAQHERLRTFKIITSNMVHEQSAEFSFRDHSHIESIHVQGAEKTEIMTCHSLRSVHLQNCNNLKLLLPHVRLSSLVLHDDDEIMSNRCVLEIDLEHCATLNMCSNNKRTFMFHQRTTVDHLIVKSMHHLDHNQFDDLLTKHTLARFIQLSSRDPLTSTDRFLLTLVPDVKSICVERKQETGSGYEIAIAETTPQYIQKLTSLTSLEHESIRNVAFHRVSGSINCENINLLILKSCTQCVISQKTFQNLRYLTISHGGVSSLSLSLQDMPLLCEINISQSHF
ncbi:hypothetical protein C9374_012305 [Naegleria lovaniensis]|uniref:Uncharacterized protein n=1 Tax=Naegleria lovaniensis TaxID=51637 RepID=A0AA88GB99_NAELO|nr:uncharacterized protein C9374_012305 [Naegleria lovaniensis]KAG2373316.1 hypothetical protein C9374_012305 [Naegleria lovaniensis]